MPTMSSFFRRYAEAYLDFNPQGLTSFFALPCMLIDDRGDYILRDENDLLAYERPFIETLEKKALHDIDTTIVAERAMDRSSQVCSVHYRLLDRHQMRIGDFDYHYILIAGDVDWRIKFLKMGEVRCWDRAAQERASRHDPRS